MTIQLRNATLADAALMCQLYAENLPQRPWSIAEFESFYDRGGVIAAIAEIDEQPVGFVFSWCIAGDCELLMIAVEEAHRRAGVGRALMQWMLQEALCQQAQWVHLETAATNKAAIALYKPLGFATQHRRKAYYTLRDGERVDALTMRLAL